MDGTTLNWLKNLAVAKNVAITGSIPIVENGKYYNRLIWCNKTGDISTYNKRHLFRMGEESEFYTPGRELVTIDCEGWKIRPFICYDLRFPVWSRNVDNSYDVLLNVANWPAPRAEVFTTLLKARAIENMCFAVGVNRVGTDGLKINYSGGSMVVDPKGKCLLGPLPGEECTESISLDYKDLSNIRTNFPAWKDADNFEILLD
jgi:predicted amidohydrolase